MVVGERVRVGEERVDTEPGGGGPQDHRLWRVPIVTGRLAESISTAGRDVTSRIGPAVGAANPNARPRMVPAGLPSSRRSAIGSARRFSAVSREGR